MRIIADLHIHSKYSRATSKQMNIDSLTLWAQKKGVNLLGTGDFTHPGWLGEINTKLSEDGSGFLQPKVKSKIQFVLSSEISSIYSDNGKVRRIHNLVLVPSIASARKISQALGKRGNIWSDGRPIFGISSRDIAALVKDIEKDAIIIPAHIWTPWFSLFGSMSGYDTIAECFKDMSKFIYAAETGLSSDPEMNWRLSALDKITLVSNSDCHSPSKLGREANVFEVDENKFNFKELDNILKTKDSKRFPFTIEFFPEEGKYHYDGHRSCGVVLSPQETKKLHGKCPKCGRPLTVGVMSRVDDLADRPEGYTNKKFPKSVHLIPLIEILADLKGVKSYTKSVLSEYDNLVSSMGSEMEILYFLPEEKLTALLPENLASAIITMRQGRVIKKPGYDGVYGVIKVKKELIKKEEKGRQVEQKKLF